MRRAGVGLRRVATVELPTLACRVRGGRVVAVPAFSGPRSRAATEVGGVIANANPAVVSALAAYGDALGISFQIADDLLDYEGNATQTGKNVGDDFREGKLTLPLIKAIAQADASERAFWQRVIESGDQKPGDLEQALEILARHGALQATRADALHWAGVARSALDALPDTDLRALLGELSDYVVARLV